MSSAQEASADILPCDLERVLVVMTDHHLGNTVISMPVIAALAEYFTQGIDLLVDERYLPLFGLMSCSKTIRLVTYPHQTGKRRGLRQNIQPALLMMGLWAKRYQAVIDICGGIRSSSIVLSTLRRVRIGFSDTRRNWCYTHKIVSRSGLHWYERYAQILRCIGQTQAPPCHRLQAPPEARDRVEAKLRDAFGHAPGPIAVIHPSSGKLWRRWPPGCFAQVADSLVQDYRMNICVIGTESERLLGQELIHQMNHKAHARYLAMPVVDLVALFELASILVSNESGPTHLAATTDLPIVTIFGPTRESLWRPIRPDRLITLRGAECDPRCGRNQCVAQMRCLNQLTPAEVMRAVGSLLNPKPSGAVVSAPPIAAAVRNSSLAVEGKMKSRLQ